MKQPAISRNYAEALFALGEQSGQTARYAELLDAVAGAIELSTRVQDVLMSPRVSKTEKARLLADALPAVPAEFVLFLQAVVKRGRQRLLGEISAEYLALLDVKLGRVRAAVTLASEPAEALRQSITAALEQALDLSVIPQFRTEPAIMGGAVVRVGDRVFDGSVRRRMALLRRQLLSR